MPYGCQVFLIKIKDLKCNRLNNKEVLKDSQIILKEN